MLLLLLLLPGTCTFAQGGKRIHYVPKVGSDLHVHVSAMSVRGRREVDTCTTRSWGKEAGEKKIKDDLDAGTHLWCSIGTFSLFCPLTKIG